jgi:sulfur-oxidizing protein SoxZ
MVLKHNGNLIVDSDIGSSISKNPYFKFNVAGARGDKIELTYKDSKGKTGTKTVKSK